MLFVVLAPYGHHPQPLPVPPMEDTAVAAYTPVPASYMVTRVLVSSVFFGPFGALVGLGVGLLFSGTLQWWQGRRTLAQK